MDSSGERFIPKQADPFDEIAVEHQQRYHSVKNLVRGKVVLDAGSGEGYGAYLLAETAARVVGIDISQEAIDRARTAYKRQNLEYQVGSVDALPFEDGYFDVVVSFEVIEHLEEAVQAAFLGEARRVLKREGILVISTPNKAIYSDPTHHHNRFHKKEFYIDEFESFLQQTFPKISLFGQSWVISSVLQRPASKHLDNLKPANDAQLAPKYVVAVCGATRSAHSVDLSSVVVDRRGRFEKMVSRVVELQDEVETKNSWVASREQEIERLGSRILELQDEVARKDSWASSLNDQIESLGEALVHYKKEAAEFEAGLVKAHKHISSLDAHIADLDARIQSQVQAISDLEHRVESLRGKEAELESIKQSDFWRVATRYWRLRDKLLPNGSRRRRMLKAAFRSSKAGIQAIPRVFRGKWKQPAQEAPAPPWRQETAATYQPGGPEEPIRFPRVGRPKVSIIVPAFNQWTHTYRCMKSIQQTMSDIPCEIILADDRSEDMTARAEEIVTGVNVLHAGKNRGFLRNCNWAASRARGQYLYFLNNDTELRPGAIQALVALLDRDRSVGMAGSKLVYPDRRLQEAGGIIWADASGWNFGKGQDASLPAFNYVKEVDYVSAASFMIRKDLWREIGGFDDRYAPAYCEDSDLAFEVRKRGLKVVYQPRSEVVHFEGASHGTDLLEATRSHKACQTEILKAKWAAELARQFPNGTNIFHARDRSAGRKTILVIDHYVPQIDKDAGSRTMWSFIQAFLRMGLSIKFLGDNFFPHQPYTDMLEQAGVEVLTGTWFADNWPEWLAENGRWLDYVFLSRPHIAPKYLGPVRTHTKARVLYYVHDLQYLRGLKLAEIENDPSLKARAERDRKEEQDLMKRMDVVFSCSDIEANVIHELCPDVDVFYVPAYSYDVDLASDFDPKQREGLLFVGGFTHPPNADGVLWFIRDVWPAVRQRLPGVILSIAGSHPPPEVLSLASDDVKVLGFVSDQQLGELYRTSRLVVIPLRYGAGVKGKTVEAMAYGVPVVCTECGVEGMPGVEDILDPMQHRAPLTEGIVALYNDVSKLVEISKRERSYVTRHFNLEKIQTTFAQALMLREQPAMPGMSGSAGAQLRQP